MIVKYDKKYIYLTNDKTSLESMFECNIQLKYIINQNCVFVSKNDLIKNRIIHSRHLSNYEMINIKKIRQKNEIIRMIVEKFNAL